MNNMKKEIANNENSEKKIKEILKNNIKNHLNLNINTIYILQLKRNIISS